MEKIEWKVSYSFIKWVKLDSSSPVNVIDSPQGVVKAGEKTERDKEWGGRGREAQKIKLVLRHREDDNRVGRKKKGQGIKEERLDMIAEI